MAAVGLVSPANKDRPDIAASSRPNARVAAGRVACAGRCGNVAQHNLYAELLELIGQWDPSLGERPPATYAVTCRWRPRRRWLESWNQSLQPGLPLPPLPFWLTEDFAIPLDLEASYGRLAATCGLPDRRPSPLLHCGRPSPRLMPSACAALSLSPWEGGPCE